MYGQYTLGVEEEFQIVDPVTGELRARVEEVLEAGHELRGQINLGGGFGFSARLDGSQEVPANASPGTATPPNPFADPDEGLPTFGAALNSPGRSPRGSEPSIRSDGRRRCSCKERQHQKAGKKQSYSFQRIGREIVAR